MNENLKYYCMKNLMRNLFFQIRNIQKKMQSLEGQFDSCTEQLFEATVKLEQKEKVHLKLDGLLGYFMIVSST